jgi:hypothetical protein
MCTCILCVSLLMNMAFSIIEELQYELYFWTYELLYFLDKTSMTTSSTWA